MTHFLDTDDSRCFKESVSQKLGRTFVPRNWTSHRFFPTNHQFPELQSQLPLADPALIDGPPRNCGNCGAICGRGSQVTNGASTKTSKNDGYLMEKWWMTLWQFVKPSAASAFKTVPFPAIICRKRTDVRYNVTKKFLPNLPKIKFPNKNCQKLSKYQKVSQVILYTSLYIYYPYMFHNY